jgi:hypothetical protein
LNRSALSLFGTRKEFGNPVQDRGQPHRPASQQVENVPVALNEVGHVIQVDRLALHIN